MQGLCGVVGCCHRNQSAELPAESSRRARAPANWSIGFLEGKNLVSLKERAACPNPRFTKNDIAQPISDFVADPFLVRDGKRWLLFFELFNQSVGKGEIGLAESDDLCNWRYQGVVLAESFHLSYPHVLKVGREYFMIPESKRAAEVRLYRATSFPHKWKFERALIHGEFSDATPFHWQRRWWMFANRAPYSLALFSARSLKGPYLEHPLSPLFAGDMSRARPGGGVVVRGGAPYRFVQDNREGYGKRLRMVRINKLSPTEYQEEISQPDPILREGQSSWNSFGMHHLSAVQRRDGTWVAAVDGNSR